MDKFKFLANPIRFSQSNGTREKISKLPKEPGVYCFKKGRKILYLGKAVNIRERVKNHFRSPAALCAAWDVDRIGYIKTNSEIEALILEARLIKKYQPKYNVVWRDDKNFFYVGITKEDFPRVFITHQPAKMSNVNYIGPFVDGSSLKMALKSLRKVFPFRSCRVLPKKPCLWYQLDRCPAPCLTKSKLSCQIPKAKTKMKKEYQKNIKNLIKILQGKKKQVVSQLKKEIKELSKKEQFERAGKIRDQITSLEYILAHSHLSPFYTYAPMRRCEEGRVLKNLKEVLNLKKIPRRIEAYDVSNIQGQLATGSMITFSNGKLDKNFYRRFKVKISGKPNDIAMLKEVLWRRLKHKEWPLPDLILIDGGIGQLKAALKTKNQKPKTKNQNKIRIISLAKGTNKLYVDSKKNPIFLKNLPQEISNLILQIRDQAHRFAINYHKKLRKKEFFS